MILQWNKDLIIRKLSLGFPQICFEGALIISIHPSIRFHVSFSGVLEHIQAVIGWAAEYTLHRLPVCRRANTETRATISTHIYFHIHTYGEFSVSD